MDKAQVAYAPLAFIRAALCPLEFRCSKLGNDPAFAHIVREVPAFSQLEVGDCLRYESVFPYNDRNKHRKLASQIVTTPLGLSPVDSDILFGLCTYLRSLDEFPPDLQLKFTIDFRRVYATMIDEWMGYGDTRSILKGDFPSLGVFA